MYVLEINTVRPQVTGFGVQEKKTVTPLRTARISGLKS